MDPKSRAIEKFMKFEPEKTVDHLSHIFQFFKTT